MTLNLLESCQDFGSINGEVFGGPSTNDCKFGVYGHSGITQLKLHVRGVSFFGNERREWHFVDWNKFGLGLADQVEIWKEAVREMFWPTLELSKTYTLK